MIVKTRIASIRLIDKMRNNPEYANEIGVFATLRKKEVAREKVGKEKLYEWKR